MSNSEPCPCKCHAHDLLQVPQCGLCCYGGEPPTPADLTLAELLEKARNHVMTDEERQSQRESWVRGEMALSEYERGMTTKFPPADPVAPSPSAEAEAYRIAKKYFNAEVLAVACSEAILGALAAHSAQQEQTISDLRKQVEERGRMIAAASAVLNDKDFSLVEKLAAAESQLERLSQRIVRQAETIEKRQASWHEMQSQLEGMRLSRDYWKDRFEKLAALSSSTVEAKEGK